jgi:hypothetical protein
VPVSGLSSCVLLLVPPANDTVLGLLACLEKGIILARLGDIIGDLLGFLGVPVLSAVLGFWAYAARDPQRVSRLLWGQHSSS